MVAYNPELVRHKRLANNDLRQVLNKKTRIDYSYSPASPPPTYFSPPSTPMIPLYREGEEDEGADDIHIDLTTSSSSPTTSADYTSTSPLPSTSSSYDSSTPTTPLPPFYLEPMACVIITNLIMSACHSTSQDVEEVTKGVCEMLTQVMSNSRWQATIIHQINMFTPNQM